MKSVVIYSGGLDSTVLLYKLAAEGSLHEAISVNYGQRHFKELEMAEHNCKKLNIKHMTADLSGLAPIFGKNALTNISVEVPDSSYAPENIAVTVVPNRNMLLLSIAAARAMASNADSVAYAAHGGDHALYPDCTPQFAEALGYAIELADERKIKLLRPFVNLSKSDIVKIGSDLDVDFSATWSCYKGGSLHCGQCSTCRERREAFKTAGIQDPTPYA